MNGSLLIRGAEVLLSRGWAQQTDVRIVDGLIDRIGQGLAAAGAREMRAEGWRLVPGFVDLHVHGVGGAFCESGETEQVLAISRSLARYGVTGFLATIASLPAARAARAVEAVAFAMGAEEGARILGIHLEGPFLNRRFAGAQNPRWMRAPSVEEFDALSARCSHQIRMLTVAPELAGAVPLVGAVHERGVVVALGHSGASEEETLLAVDAGASYVTHLFNAMGSFHHRDVGLLGVALLDERLTVELLADGHHVHPRALALAWRLKGNGQVVLASDSVAAGVPEGSYRWGRHECLVQHGTVRLRKNGRLAGSCLTLDQAVRNVCQWLPEVPLAQVLNAASAAPCRVLGLSRLGKIEEGAEGDLVLLDSSLQVRRTIVRGEVVYDAEA